MVDARRRRKIARRLLEYGRKNALGPPDVDGPEMTFAYNNDNPFLFAVIFDQLVNADEAWKAPYRLKRRLGHFNVRKIARMPLPALRRAISGGRAGPALARYPGPMATFIKGAARLLVDKYGANAGRIWEDCLTAAEVIARLDEFPGIGPKKAHMAARMLVEEGVDITGFKYINVAVDVQVRRVWERLGLVRKHASVPDFHAAAAEMHPRFPGELDEPTWLIGRGWCYKSDRKCHGNDDGDPCPLEELCPSTCH